MKILAGILPFVICLPLFASIEDDIFTNTDQTRRQAQGDEFNMALRVGGCAGCLLGPKTALSAGHCSSQKSVTSGMALKQGKASDGRVGSTLEKGSVWEYDYWIFKIRWNSGKTPKGMDYVPRIQIHRDEIKVGPNHLADKIYTLGFPVDISNGKLIRAWGYGKDYIKEDHINNISLINGNSGGCLFRDADDMVASVVSGGPHAFGQTGWQGNNWNDKSHWNWGPAIYQVYEKSKTLKDIFPDGKNKNLGG